MANGAEDTESAVKAWMHEEMRRGNVLRNDRGWPQLARLAVQASEKFAVWRDDETDVTTLLRVFDWAVEVYDKSAG